MLDLATRRALEFSVGEGVLPETELSADAIGHPAAAEIFIERDLFQTARKHLRGGVFPPTALTSRKFPAAAASIRSESVTVEVKRTTTKNR